MKNVSFLAPATELRWRQQRAGGWGDGRPQRGWAPGRSGGRACPHLPQGMALPGLLLTGTQLAQEDGPPSDPVWGVPGPGSMCGSGVPANTFTSCKGLF